MRNPCLGRAAGPFRAAPLAREGAGHTTWTGQRLSTPCNPFAPLLGQWYKSLATRFTKCARAQAASVFRGRPGKLGLEFANLPVNFAETLELVFVGITIVVTLAILVAFGQWWQR